MNKFETSSYKTIKSALVNRNLKQALYDEGKVIMDGVLLTLHGEEHRKRRKLEHRVFQRDFFKYYEQELFPKTLDETINPFLKKGKNKKKMEILIILILMTFPLSQVVSISNKIKIKMTI